MPTTSPIRKPTYIDPAGDSRLSALSVAPPFLFRNVTARVFSLEANVAVLTAFCEQYLNMDIPPTVVHYAPALPCVYLMVLNYGSMAPSSVQAQNVGWVAQHEVAFTVVLQRWREENGDLVFKDWATVSPFIYVDDQLSLSTGREVYGWNKVTGTIEADIPLWVTDPEAKVRQFQLGLVDFAEAYVGDNPSKQTLLEIDLDPPTTFTTFPPDPRNPWSPLWALPNAIANTASLAGGLLDTALSLRIRGYEAHRSRDGLKAMSAVAREKLKGVFPPWLPSRGQNPNLAAVRDAVHGLPTLFFDNVTLKQFRNPENPNLACYQALVESKMGVDRVNRAGLLGDVNLLRGDTSGGYSVRIHQYDSQPIIQTLGLQVASWDRADTGAQVATLKPILPYWLDVDLFYGKGEVICSRAHGAATDTAGYWRDEQPDAMPETPPPPETLTPALYNTTLGAATQPIVGPFHFPDVTLQVYPLLSDRSKLERVLKDFLNDHLASAGMTGPAGGHRRGWRFEPLGSYVYMIATVYGDELGAMWSATDNIGGLFEREVTFVVPVKWYDENGELVTVAVVEPFTYSNNGRAVTTDREVNGYNSIRATIESPPDAWMTPNGPIARRRFLRLDTEVIPALNVGQKAQQRTLLEIDERHVLPGNDAAGWGDVADTWGRVVTDELRRKTYLASADPNATDDAKALALEILAHGAPLNRVIVKQYRDGEELDKACYQALVHATSAITSVYDIREMSSNVHVRVHRQPGHPIVAALGLKTKHQESSDGAVVDILQPLRPFWMRIAMKEDLATVARYRSHDGPWQIVHPWFENPRPDIAAASPPASRRFSASGKPYFKEDTETRIGAWLARDPPQTIPPRPSGDSLGLFSNAGDVDAWLAHRSDGEIVGGNLHLDLKNEANEWLRRSLINELAWIRVCIEPSWANLVDRFAGDEDTARFLACPIEPNAMTNFGELYSIRDLYSIVARVSRLLASDEECPGTDLPDDLILTSNHGPDPTPSENHFVATFEINLRIIRSAFSAFFQQSTEGIRSKGLAWSWAQFLDGLITNHIFSEFSQHFDCLSDGRKQAFLMTLPKSAYPLLLDTSAYIGSSQYQFDTTFQDYQDVSLVKIQDVVQNVARARFLSDMIDRGMLDWTYPTRWRRVSRQGAAIAISSLEEIQVIIDDILSSEWENHGQSARFLNPKGGRKPTECLHLEHPLYPIARLQGLERWIDPVTGQASEFWVVPMPGASDPILGTGGPGLPLTPLGPTGSAPPPGSGAGTMASPAQGEPAPAAE